MAMLMFATRVLVARVMSSMTRLLFSQVSHLFMLLLNMNSSFGFQKLFIFF